MLVVTHEVGFAYRAADRILLMNEGEIVEEGTPDKVLTTPRPLVKNTKTIKNLSESWYTIEDKFLCRRCMFERFSANIGRPKLIVQRSSPFIVEKMR